MDQLRVCVSQCKDEFEILKSHKEAYTAMVKKARAELAQGYETLGNALDQNYKDLTSELNRLEKGGMNAITTRWEQMEKRMSEMEAFIKKHEGNGNGLNEDEQTNASLLIKWQEHQNKQQLKRVEFKFKPSQLLDQPKSKISIGDLQCTEVDTTAKVFTTRPCIHRAIPMGGCVAGIAIHSQQVFITMLNRQYIEVFDTTTFESVKQLKVPELFSPEDLVISTVEKILFISEPSYKNIHRVTLEGKAEKNWAVDGDWTRVSVTQNNTLLLAVAFTDYPSRILEYSTFGKFLRSTTLDASIERPVHVIKISDFHFTICHRGSKSSGLHRVCVVDTRGSVVQSFGETKGSGSGRLHSPTALAVDRYDHVFVCDSKNNRIVVLGPSLSIVGEVRPEEEPLNLPVSICYDEINRLLYVGEDSGQRVVIIKPSQ